MEEQILYKAKRLDGKGWVEGYLVKKTLHNKFDSPPTLIYERYFIDGGSDLIRFDDIFEQVEIDIKTLCRYIGFQDKEEKKIFTNDFDDKFDVVSWCESRMGFSLKTYDHPTKQFIHCNCYDCEGNFCITDDLVNQTLSFNIIGNIHD